jgi:hypoxanthine phosphoribosyltransferase
MYGFNIIDSRAFLLKALDFIHGMNADTVGGPVLSGAVMAAAIGAASLKTDRPLISVFLNKARGMYVRDKHDSTIKHMYLPMASTVVYPQRIVIVDDCVSTGAAMMFAIEEVIKEWPESVIVAALVSGSFSAYGKAAIRKQVSDIICAAWDRWSDLTIREV